MRGKNGGVSENVLLFAGEEESEREKGVGRRGEREEWREENRSTGKQKDEHFLRLGKGSVKLE